MSLYRIFNVANMSFIAIAKNKTLSKISEFTVSIHTNFFSVNSFPASMDFFFRLLLFSAHVFR